MYNRDYDRQYENWHRYGRERGWFDRAADEVRSWFGDEDAERRRRIDQMEQSSQRGGMWGRNEWGSRGEGREREREYGREGSLPGWHQRDYSGPSPRGSELEERGRYGMESGIRRDSYRQRHWEYAPDEEYRGGEYGGSRFERDDIERGGGYRGGMFGRREEMYGSERGFGDRERQRGYGERFYGRANREYGGRDFESGMGWGRSDREWEQEQGWRNAPSRGMFGSTERGSMFGGNGERGNEWRGERERGSMFGGQHRGRGPRNYQRSDERILDEIHQILTFHPEIDASDIDVTVEQGVVTLRGKVENRSMKRLAEDVCEDVFGVREVHNELRTEQGLFGWKRNEEGSNTGRGNLLSGR